MSIATGSGSQLRSLDDLHGYSTYWGFATDEDGTVVENRGGSTYHMTATERADNFLSRAQDSVNNYFGRMDDLASSANATTGAQVFAAATYGVRKIASDTINGIIGLPRLVTSNTMVPGMFNAAAHPLQTTRSIITSFGNMPVQDRLITGLEMALPFKGNIESLAGRLPRAGKFLQGTFSYSTDYGVTLTAGDATYGFLGDGVGNGLPGKWGNQVGAIEIPRFGRIDTFNYGSYLRDLIGPPPEGMVDPHAHHILFKQGNGAAQQALVQEGQALLRRYDIDPIFGAENLTWAPNRVAGQHGIDALRNVVDSLKSVEEYGGTRGDIVKQLERLGQLAAQRK
jgi:hypothetical protein